MPKDHWGKWVIRKVGMEKVQWQFKISCFCNFYRAYTHVITLLRSWISFISFYSFSRAEFRLMLFLWKQDVFEGRCFYVAKSLRLGPGISLLPILMWGNNFISFKISTSISFLPNHNPSQILPRGVSEILPYSVSPFTEGSNEFCFKIQTWFPTEGEESENNGNKRSKHPSGESQSY